jgi:hypothetical protein
LSWRYERIKGANMNAYVMGRFQAADPHIANVFTSIKQGRTFRVVGKPPANAEPSSRF